MAIHEEIYKRLIDEARRESTITYREVAEITGLDLEKPDHRNQLSWILGEISTYEHEQGRPLLSVIVVLSDIQQPSYGFYTLACDLGLYHGHTDLDEMEYFAKELKRVHEFWRNQRME
ncbi:MAG: hypothetical protein JW963_26455 [Anaerolineales bacterium]|nr:hypothetical protein [Anaerolineales bacterium]